jgi:quercetin dioxygenase-like cupin family protein
MPIKKIKDNPPEKIQERFFRSIINTDHLMVAVCDFTEGPWDEALPDHSHPHEQVSYVAEGEILFFCEGEPDRLLSAGDLIAIPSGIRHTIRLVSKKARLIDSFHPIRKDFLK